MCVSQSVSVGGSVQARVHALVSLENYAKFRIFHSHTDQKIDWNYTCWKSIIGGGMSLFPVSTTVSGRDAVRVRRKERQVCRGHLYQQYLSSAALSHH